MKSIFFILLIIGSPLITFSQQASGDYSPSPSILNIQNFTLSDGLAVNCLGNSFLDNKGRLWVNPCQEDARELRMSFFQFDGEKSFFYEIKPDWIKKGDLNPIWHVMGVTSDGFLFGADDQNEMIFYWHPDLKEQYFITLDVGTKLLNLVEDSQGGIMALTLEGENQRQLKTAKYHLIRLYKNQHEEISSIELNFEEELSPTPPKTFAYSLAILNDHAWFFHQQKGLVKADLNSKQIEFIPWTQFESIPPIQKEELADNDSGFEWKLISIGQNRLLLFLGRENGFFDLDTKPLHLSTNAGLNQEILRDEGDEKVLRVFLSKDKKGNLLLVSGYPEPYSYPTPTSNRQAFLIDVDGNYLNYSNLIEKLSFSYEYDFQHEGNFFSDDFKTEIGSSQRRVGIAFMDIQTQLNITKIHGNPSYKRGQITSIDNSTLIFNSQMQVYRYDWIDGEWKWSRLTGGDFLRARPFSSIILRDGKVWMSADFYLEKRVGLQWYDISTNETDYLPTDTKFEKFVFLNNQEVAFFKDNGDEGDGMGDLFIFNLTTQAKRPFLYESEPFSIHAKVNDLFLQGDSLLWVGAQNGLWSIDLKNNEVDHFLQVISLQNQNILNIHPDEKGRLWLGTASQGLLIFDPKTNTIKQISEDQGLANNTVVGILSDDDGNCWVSTYNGISVLDSSGTVLLELNQEDGLIHNNFHKQSSYRLPDGRMVFGGYAGTILLDPEAVLQKTELKKPNSIYLTGLEYYNDQEKKNVYRQGSYDLDEPLVIPAAQRFLMLDFALSDYGNIKEHAYMYRLLPNGSSNEQESSAPWINIGSASQMTINNIPPGNYIVQVKGIDFKSNQSLVPLEIPILVKEYFYNQWWFYALVAIPFLIVSWIYIRRIQTERNRLEIEVQHRTSKIQKDKETIFQQTVQMQELDESKSRFFTNISHEFRTPLTVILGVAEQIKQNEKEKGLIRRNARLLLNLINQILRLRKLESGPEKIHMVQGDVLKHIQYVIESFHSLAEEKGIAMKFDSNTPSLVLDYDPEKLLHILSNLLTNAIKFTPKNGTVSVTVQAFEDVEPPYYELTVEDNGIGIPQDKLNHIFDRFYQVDDEQSRTGSGTGIGLTLVWELVKILNGKIHVNSIEGKHTNFSINLPITRQAGLDEFKQSTIEWMIAEEAASFEYISDKNANSQHPSLLIVEDNADVRTYLASCLEDDFQIQFAMDGQMGINMALEHVPDIILSDVMMPKANGFTLCNVLKSDVKTSHIPIVLLTAKADIDSRITGLEKGADAYLAKPFDKRELLIQLHNLLSQRKRLQERYSNLKSLPPVQDEKVKQEDEFIIRLREIILAHIDNSDFGVPELCSHAFMSRTQLHNKIKSLTNKATSHFIRQVRMEKASELLCDSDLNISQVALGVGIESLSYFSRIFSEDFGVSPQKYREIHCSNNK
ncbi:response regulator [Algoriphagus lutimaris]|uniref:hybrid sensor histidine kinase/response regulator transcription factor n=1 Tax=Algoriphagus lutimaris TaxID=613197 RepID=UPI00196BAB6D|nr:hybrid sensor histidine kinase/response regulator transcription factor [Algoriphagus lutimaris]MBN3519360.1 response regulator [Algoriphagus lutimaris]